MKTADRSERVFSPVGVEARYPAPKSWIGTDPSRSWVRRMWPVMWSHKRYFLAAWVASFVVILLGLASPLLIRSAVNLLTKRDIQPIRMLVLGMVGLAVARFLVGMVSRQSMMRAAYGIEYDLRSIIYEHLSRMSFAFYDRVQTGPAHLARQLRYPIRADVPRVRADDAHRVPDASSSRAAIMFSINPLLTIVALAPMPGRLGRRHEDAEADVPDLVDRASAYGRSRHDRRGERHRRSHREILRCRAPADQRAGRCCTPCAVGEREAGRYPRELLPDSAEPARAGPGSRPPFLRRLSRHQRAARHRSHRPLQLVHRPAHCAVPDPRVLAHPQRTGACVCRSHIRDPRHGSR